MALFLLVIAVSGVGLAIAFGGTYWMNRSVGMNTGNDTPASGVNGSNGRGI